MIPGATVQPLTVHNALITHYGDVWRNNLFVLLDVKMLLIFNQQAQTWLESLSFNEAGGTNGWGQNFAVVKHGKGSIAWIAYPVELAEGDAEPAQLYSLLLEKDREFGPHYEHRDLSPGVMVYPIVLEDSILYVIVSDDARPSDIDLTDKSTGVHIALKLAAQHAALALIGKKEKAVIAEYGF